MTSKSETAMETDPISKPQSQANSRTETSSSHSKSQTLPDSTSNATQPSFSKLLQGVMAANSAASPHPLVKEVRIQADFGRSHQQALADVTAKAEEAQKQQDQTKTSAIIHEEKQSLQYKDHVQEAKERVDKLDGKERDSGHIKERANDTPWAANSDGYSWRKYGQKQVKNSGSSRSYYRCTYLNCYAKKKVQHLDASGRIIAVVYKGEHNHDPPQHLKVSNRKRDGNSAQKLDDRHIMTSTYRKEVEQAVESQNTQCRESNPNSSSSISQRDAGEEHIKIPDPTQRLKNEVATLPIEAEHRKSSKSDEVGRTDPKKNCDVIPLKKRRIKEFSKACSESVYRTFKEPKVVVHTAGDGESSSDGYRWRKYGQKMVKGNPNPRSYYRCSSAGCPVRKHVERATDNSTAMIVTYEGTHDHEKPVLKKCHSSLKSPPHVTTPTTPGQKSEPKSPTRTQAQSLPKSRDVDSDNEGDKPAEVGSDKVLESARTLLSIGIELKSC